MASTAARAASQALRTRKPSIAHVTAATTDMDAARTNLLIESLGGVSQLAEAVGVSKSQPSRWRRGEERPGPEAKARMLALAYAIETVMTVMPPDAAQIWMASSNDYLDGTTPFQALIEQGPEAVVAAARAEVRRAYS